MVSRLLELIPAAYPCRTMAPDFGTIQAPPATYIQYQLHETSHVLMEVENGCISKWVFPSIGGFPPKIIHFDRVFPYKPSILGTTIFGNTQIGSVPFKYYAMDSTEPMDENGRKRKNTLFFFKHGTMDHLKLEVLGHHSL